MMQVEQKKGIRGKERAQQTNFAFGRNQGTYVIL